MLFYTQRKGDDNDDDVIAVVISRWIHWTSHSGTQAVDGRLLLNFLWIGIRDCGDF